MSVFEPKSQEEFDAKLKEAKGPVVVDFVAEGCGACDPAALDKLATDCATQATIMRVETTSEFGNTLANTFKVDGTPTTLLADSGEGFGTEVNPEGGLLAKAPDAPTEVDPESKAVRRKLKCAR